jgi:uncharacterized protein with HEPN domain
MKGQLSDKIRVHHVLDAITEVENYIAGVTENEFMGNSEKRFATIKQVEIIGEACNKMSEELKNKFPDVPWHQIIGFRNISIHEYHNVSFHIVWGIATLNLPTLKKQMGIILHEFTNIN